MKEKVADVLFRGASFSVLWLAYTDGDLRYPVIGVIGVGAATAASLTLLPAGAIRLRLLGVPPFLFFFLQQSFLGGLDVARRALDPRRNVDPGFIEYETDLPEGALILLADICSLLPGTVDAEVRPRRLLVHVLDRRIGAEEKLQQLDAKLQAMVVR